MGILNFFKKEKRNAITGWIGWSSAISDYKGKYLAGNLPQVRRSLQLYANLLNTTPLVALNKEGKEVDHYLLKVLRKPTRYLSRHEFFCRLVESYFLDGNFYCLIDSNGEGKIKNLLPFLSGTMYAYAGSNKNNQGDNSDPVTLNEAGSYFYQSQFGEGDRAITNKYHPEDIWHIKSTWQSQDLLNGASLFEAYTQAIELGQDSLETAVKFAKSGMVGPVLISGVETESPEAKQETKESIENFFKNKGQFLTLAGEIELKDLMVKQPADFLRFLSSVSSLHIARLLSIPIELLNREDAMAGSGMGGQAMKEVFRFWVKTSGRGFLDMIAQKLNELASDVTFKFQIRSVQSSDMRELAMSVNQLIQSGAMTTQEAKEWLKDG